MFADQRHAAFKVTWNVYQTELPTKEKKIMTQLITSLHSSIPTGLQKLRSLGQTMTRHRDDILAFSSTTPAPATAPPKRSVSLGSAGLGLAGQDGVGRVDRGVTLEAIGPLAVSFR